MATILEIERKFLVDFPSSWSELAEMFDSLIDIKRISQTYLEAESDELSSRVRKTIEGLAANTNTIFHFNQKKFIKPGINEEKEHEISKSQYEKYLQKPHPDKLTIEKTRFVFKYNNQVFELDLFKRPLKDLALLEIELKDLALLEIELDDLEKKIELPPFLKIIEEVTKNKRFSNSGIANKKLYEIELNYIQVLSN